MQKLQATRIRRELELRPDIKLTPDDVYRLVLAETENEEQAQEAARLYGVAMLRNSKD